MKKAMEIFHRFFYVLCSFVVYILMILLKKYQDVLIYV